MLLSPIGKRFTLIKRAVGWYSSLNFKQPYHLTDVSDAYHEGVDLQLGIPPSSVDLGRPVYGNAGRVLLAERVRNANGSLSTFGNMIVTQCNDTNGTILRHAHLSEMYVKKGDVLKTGQIIGRVGGVGSATITWEPHLHFSLAASQYGICKLIGNPIYWPGLDLAELEAVFTDPGQIEWAEYEYIGDTRKVTATVLNARTGPSTTFPVKTALQKDEVVHIQAIATNGWLQTQETGLMWSSPIYFEGGMPDPPPPVTVQTGINADKRNVSGHAFPKASAVAGTNFLVFVPNTVDENKVQYTPKETGQQYGSWMRELQAAGVTPVVVFNWECGAQGVVPNYNDKTYVANVLAQAARDMFPEMPPHCKIVWWNEPDGLTGNVPLTPEEFALMSNIVIPVVQTVQPTWEIWAGGYCQNHPNDWATAKVKMKPQVRAAFKAVAYHPYGHGDPVKFPDWAHNGTIRTLVANWQPVLDPGQKLVFTEFSILDHTALSEAEALPYLTSFLQLCAEAGITVACWFAFGRQANGLSIYDKPNMQRALGVKNPVNPNPAPDDPGDPLPTPALPMPPGAISWAGLNLIGPGSPNPLRHFRDELDRQGKHRGPNVDINQLDTFPAAGLTGIGVVREHPGGGRFEPDPYDWQGRRWSAPEWWNYWHPRLAGYLPGDAVIFEQFDNEVDWLQGKAAWRAAWTIDLMQIASEAGVRITYGNFKIMGIDLADLPHLVAMCVEGRKRGHLLRFNTGLYLDVPVEEALRRFNFAKPLLDAVPDTPFFIGELGTTTNVNDAAYGGVEATVLAIRTARQHYNYPGAKGFSLWGANGSGGNWPHSNIPEGDYPAIIQAVG